MSKVRPFSPSTASIALLLLGLAGCAGTPIAPEKAARRQVEAVATALMPLNTTPSLPELGPASAPEDYVRFALLKHPAVRAAYFDWRAKVEAIAPARSLPDPRLTFEADIADAVMTLMPGLMFDFMGPGKLSSMGREAAADSQVAYRRYVGALLSTAARVRDAWIELAYVDEALRLREGSRVAIEQSAALDASNYATGSGMASLEAQVLFQNQTAELQSVIAALEDRRAAARTRFKASLGLMPDEPDPAWPSPTLRATPIPSENALWSAIDVRNPELASMRAMVDMAVAGVEVAQKTGRPDFALGAMADVKANPLMIRPQASLSLPIWRDKIAATIAGAEARRDAARARVDAERLTMAAELAQMLYMVRESDRMIAYLERTALPNLERSIASAEAAYQSGMSGAGMIPQTQLMALGMKLERAEALRARETAMTALLLMSADVLPSGTGLLASAEPAR
ncbi:TolC family protein [Opitutaceae bacterium EW11]|nr:TolC family protein [Opitutaceae bacterium EW11]